MKTEKLMISLKENLDRKKMETIRKILQPFLNFISPLLDIVEHYLVPKIYTNLKLVMTEEKSTTIYKDINKFVNFNFIFEEYKNSFSKIIIRTSQPFELSCYNFYPEIILYLPSHSYLSSSFFQTLWQFVFIKNNINSRKLQILEFLLHIHELIYNDQTDYKFKIDNPSYIYRNNKIEHLRLIQSEKNINHPINYSVNETIDTEFSFLLLPSVKENYGKVQGKI